MVTACATWADGITVDGTFAETNGVTVDGTCAVTDVVTVDRARVETDGVTVDGTCAENDSVAVDAAPLLIGGGRGFVMLAGLRDAVESEGRSGSV